MMHSQASLNRADAPQRIVVIGGGTGNSTVLSGLKPLVGSGLTAIVNTFDDGGGTGRLRDEYGDLPAVGDLRQCLRALSSLPPDELALLDHRFQQGAGDGGLGLHGQALGNLILLAASQHHGGNFADALKLAGRLYGISGSVLAASHDNRRLQITLADGAVIRGQHQAESSDIASFQGASVGFDKSPTSISDEALRAIEQADMVVLAPGDLYTSIAPNLVVDGMREALQRAGMVVLVVNLMNRSRHTAGFSALDYAREYERLIGDRVIDCVLYNTEALDGTSLASQMELGSSPVSVDAAALQAAGYIPVAKNLLSHEPVQVSPDDHLAYKRSTIRHDPAKVAAALMEIYSARLL